VQGQARIDQPHGPTWVHCGRPGLAGATTGAPGDRPASVL